MSTTRAPRHPPYALIIRQVLARSPHPRKGMSLQAIRNAIQKKYSLPDSCRRGIRLALHRGLRTGLVSRGSSGQMYKLGDAAAAKKRRTSRINEKKQKKKINTKSSPAASPAGSPPASPLKKKAVLVKKIAKVPVGIPKKMSKKFTKAFKWQFLENDGRFHDYDAAASDAVEQCYEEYLKNPHMMDVRAVRSGDWQYQVDFINMKQTNIDHQNHKVRNVRRVEV